MRRSSIRSFYSRKVSVCSSRPPSVESLPGSIGEIRHLLHPNRLRGLVILALGLMARSSALSRHDQTTACNRSDVGRPDGTSRAEHGDRALPDHPRLPLRPEAGQIKSATELVAPWWLRRPMRLNAGCGGPSFRSHHLVASRNGHELIGGCKDCMDRTGDSEHQQNRTDCEANVPGRKAELRSTSGATLVPDRPLVEGYTRPRATAKERGVRRSRRATAPRRAPVHPFQPLFRSAP